MMNHSNQPSPRPHQFALYTSSRGNYFFHEIRDLIGAGLRELGLAVECRDERAGFAPRADWHIVIAPHEFFELGAGRDLVPKAWPANLVLFNTEQPSTHWLALSVRHFERAAAIWDIDFESTLRNCGRGYACDYLPLGCVADSPMLREVPRLPLHEETRRLPAEVRDRSGFKLPLAGRPIDLLFLGHASPRREQYFARNADRLKRFNCFLHKPSVTRPMIPGQTTSMNTITSVGLAQRSKILLNVHHGVDKYFEWHRIVLLGIAQRALVISEPCSLAPPFEANVDFVEAPLDELPDRIEHFLGSTAGQAEAQRIIEHGFETLTARCRLADMLRPLVNQLTAPGVTRASTGARFFPASPVAAGRATPLSVCVVTPDVAAEGSLADAGSAQVALAEALARDGHHVTLLHTESRWGERHSVGHWRKHFAARCIDYIPLPACPRVPVEGSEAGRRSYETYLWLRGQSFQVVHLPDTNGIGFYSLLARDQGLEFARTRFCLNAHGPMAWRRFASQQFITHPGELEIDFMDQECCRRADALVTSTRFMLDWLERQDWSLPAERQVRPNPIATPPAATARRVRELVYLGPLNRGPGLALFCDALDRLGPEALRKTTVTFADDSTTLKGPKVLNYLNERSRKWTFAWQVGSTSPDALDEFLRDEGRLVVMPSPMENSPLALRRCLALGIPFLAVRSAGVAELIDSADQDRVLCAATGPALATALQQALAQPVAPARPAETAEALRHWIEWHDAWAAENTPPSAAAAPADAGPMPLVSVCLVHFNRPELLAQALASLRAQDYPRFEVVLVDDGSTRPEAVKYLASLEAEFKQRDWQIVRQENRYLGAARNTGARHARGEYLVFMDDDNFAKPNQLSTFIRVARRTGAEILTSAMDLFTGTEPPDPARKPKARWIFLGPAAGPGAIRNCFGDANGCIRRETFERLGGFTEDYGITHEDWEFYARATLKGCRLETLPEALFWYRAADDSMIRSTPQFANHQRSLRPYLEAVPAPLRGLIQCLQGSILFSVARGPAGPGYEPLLRLHRGMVSIARELIRAGQSNAAETMFMEVLQSAESAAQPALLMQTLLDIGDALLENGRGQLAAQLVERAVDLARASGSVTALREAEGLLAAARRAAPARKSPGNFSPDTTRFTQTRERPAATGTEVTAPAKASMPAPAVESAPQASRVSIIIPTFNNLILTRACLESIEANAAGNRPEIIVVDNGSTDGTREFLADGQKAGRLTAILNAANAGFARACNQGAAAARGAWLLFLNNDTRATAGWLEAMTRAAQKPQVGIVGARLLYADGRIQHAGIGFIKNVPDHPHRHAPADAPEVSRFRELDMVTGACLLVQRDLFLQLAGFDEIYRNGVEDVDLCLRVRAAGFKVVYEPQAVVYHLEGQSAGRFQHVTENLKIFFQRWGKSFDAGKHFLVPHPARTIPASRSVLTPSASVEPPAGGVSPDPGDAGNAPVPFSEGAASEPAPVRVAWQGTFLDYGSLSHVNRELTRALDTPPRVRLTRVRWQKTGNISAGLQELARSLADTIPSDAEIVVRHSWPADWTPPARGALVVIQPWEFGRLPIDWVRQAERVTEFWVPSSYVRRCYVESGIPETKVHVVPNGIDPDRFRPGVAPMELATKKTFKFLFVGGTIGRKGADLLLETWLRAFTAQDDVCLVIKDFGGQSVYTGQTLEARIKAAQAQANAPEILYLNDELAPDALPGLYAACDCLVHPYRGEGFGLPILEAMACGLPVIITAGGAADDFAGDEFAYRIPARRIAIGDTVGGMKLAGPGWLLEPDAAALAERMRWVVANRDEARAKGARAGEYARREWTWERAAQTAQQRLQSLAAGPPATETKVSAPAPVIVPPCGRLGNLDDARALLGRREFAPAWESATSAIRRRPFHPEAYLLLAEVALAAGDSASARQCAQHARDLAPDWKAAKHFLQKPLKGSSKPEWLKLPSGIASKASTLNPQPSTNLTVCVIARNEEQFLGQCLNSVKDLAAQIIVVDTGSTDRTVEIAKSAGAEVHHFDWCDDFSAARNAALEHATGDWILMLDADEELPAGQRDRLRADLQSRKLIACRLPLVNRGQETEGQSYVPRLFRNAPGVFYRGRVHEQVFPSLVSLSKNWGLATGLGTAQLLHHGYDKALVKDRNKIERNLKLLRRAIEENPDDANLQMNLGLELVRSGDLAGGITHYRNAFQLMSALPPGTVAPELREALLTQFTCHLYKIRAHDEVVAALTSALAKNGGLTASLHFALGLTQFELKRYREAAEQMRQCLAKRNQPGLSPINTDILTVAPHHCLAMSLAKLGDAAGAEKAFQSGLAEKESAEDLGLDYARFLAEQDRPVEALQRLHGMVERDATRAAVWRLGGEIALSRPEFLEFSFDWTGEALRHLPEDAVLIDQRAEVLLLVGQIANARSLWEKACNGARPPRALAALILCAAAGSEPVPPTRGEAEETATSRAFIEWYQRLVSAGARDTVLRLNARVDSFRGSLPTAARLLDSALAEVRDKPA